MLAESEIPCLQAEFGASETFNVVVLYSDDAATAQVMEIYRRIQKSLQYAHPLEIHLWLLDLLEEPELLAAASQDLTCAAMVVVNANDPRVVSVAFQHWVESWPMSGDNNPRALVAFDPFGDQPRTRAPARAVEWLRDLASRKGMDFISNARSDGRSSHANGNELLIKPKRNRQPVRRLRGAPDASEIQSWQGKTTITEIPAPKRATDE